jgi:Peroxisomal membrane protein (Pex16)
MDWHENGYTQNNNYIEEKLNWQQDVMAATKNVWQSVVENPLTKAWQSYRGWVRHPPARIVTEMADETISRVLWWLPAPSRSHMSSSRWREVIWGLLQLHRLAMDLALSDDLTEELESTRNSYGTTIAVNHRLNKNDHHSNAIVVAPTRLRIGLTVLQCLGPVTQEIVRSRLLTTVTNRRQAQIRLMLERTRFFLRLFLAVRYWREISPHRDSDSMTPGLMQQGGRFHTPPAPTVEEERGRRLRQEYVGRRTGRRVLVRIRPTKNGAIKSHCTENNGAVHKESSKTWGMTRIVLGELLYILRPLFWAQAEASHCNDTSSLWNAWFVSLGMDVASLTSLYSMQATGNVATREEWKRRRLRLLLYLIRSPIWDRYALPTVERVGGAIEVVPLFGKLLTTYLQDWLYYWKTYRAEEG